MDEKMLISNIKIDVVIGIGYKGGVENVVKRTVMFFKENGAQVRVIQMLDSGYNWLPDEIEFYCLNSPSNRHGIKNEYGEFLEHHEGADLVLVAGWPMLVPIVRQTVSNDTRVVSWLHGAVEVYMAENLGDYNDLKSAHAHLAINSNIEKSIRKHIGEHALIYRINNPVDIGDIAFNSNRDTKKLLFVGRFSEEKNIPFLIESLGLAPKDWTLKIIGDGDANIKENLHRRCEELGIKDRVEFEGWLEKPWAQAQDACGLVLPSKRETMPLVAIEALLCGMPVIATPVDGITELIKPGVNGYLFPHDDKEAFVQILRMIDGNKLPKISAEACRDSVAFVLDNEPLKGLCRTIIDILNVDFDDYKDSGAVIDSYFDGLKQIQKSYLTLNYDLCYLLAMHKKIASQGVSTAVVGSSHTMNGILEEVLPGGKKENINLSSSSQDLYYDKEHIKKLLTSNKKKLRNIVIELPYYALYQDLSKSKNESFLVDRVFYPLFGQDAVHNLQRELDKSTVLWPEYDKDMYSDALIKELCEKSTEEAFLAQSSYYGILPREKNNKLRLDNIFWEQLSIDERREYAKERAKQHNKQRNYKESFEENKLIIKEIADLCNKEGIRTIFVIMPHTEEYIDYIDSNFKTEIYDVLNELPYEVEVIDFTEYTTYFTAEDFYDSDHLNRTGAEKVSHILASYLQPEV